MTVDDRKPLLCSILLPSKKRLPRLLRCIESIVSTAKDKECFEFCIRLHRDDAETVAAIPTLLTLAADVKIVVGSPERGYGDLSRFYQDAAAVSRGKWVWVMNDDTIIEGAAWDALLTNETLDAILMPEIHRLGESTYKEDMETPFMFLPNKCWEKCGVTYFNTPFDQSLWTLMREHGWPTRWMRGLTAWHNRTNTDTIKEDGRY